MYEFKVNIKCSSLDDAERLLPLYTFVAERQYNGEVLSSHVLEVRHPHTQRVIGYILSLFIVAEYLPFFEGIIEFVGFGPVAFWGGLN